MKLYETITAENWIKYNRFGATHIPRGSGCLLNHLGRVYPDTRAASLRLEEAAAILYPERSHNGRWLHMFSDHQATTLDDVLRVCKLADV